MTGTGQGKLYSPQILALAVELSNYPFDPTSEAIAEVRSRSCGSSLAISLQNDPSGNILTLGMAVTACAIGQAAASIFASAAIGKSAQDIAAYSFAIPQWLSGNGALPDWPRLEMLASVRPYAGRHEAVLLPWKAASEALCKTSTSG